jgi:hypothetical protein
MSTFSQRVLAHPLISANNVKHTGVIALKDQLLVAKSVGKEVKSLLAHLGIKTVTLARLLAGPPALVPPASIKEDIEILLLTFPVGWPKARDIFWVTNELRTNKALATTKRAVSPNHVLIPAPTEDWCPHGPPSPIPHVPTTSPPGAPGKAVTVVDSGWIWHPAAWGDNPLDAHVMGPPSVHLAERHALTALTTGILQTFVGWKPGIPDVLDIDHPTNPQKLGALIGHANFVAGVIAQGCDLPRITIWSHNGGFGPKDPELCTEAGVCRSLIKSHLLTPAGVVNVGFAFPAFQGILSAAWDVVFERLGTDDLAPRVVAPAGNQGTTGARYPAALNHAYSGRYPNMIGVASFDHPSSVDPSVFSNRATPANQWVTCSAMGADVESTFLHVNLKVEDDLATNPLPRNFSVNSWASWNGTSFSAPKVTAAIAARLTATASPGQAWSSLQAALGADDPKQQLGTMFHSL